MACVFNGTYTFVSGTYNDSSVPSLDYSNYNVIFNGEQLNFIDTIRADEAVRYIFAKGGSVDDPIFPAIAIVIGFGIGAFTAEGDYVGEATISICEKEPEGSCPDAPLADSIPEKYADYIDKNGNFVPKESSGGGENCPYTTATLTVVNPNTPMLVPSVIVAPFDGETYITGGIKGSPYTVILYNGKAIISSLGGFTNASLDGDIERVSGQSYLIMTGDAKITFPTT